MRGLLSVGRQAFPTSPMRILDRLSIFRRLDSILLLAVFLLVAFGGAVLYSIGTSGETVDLSRFTTQMIAVGLGCIIVVILTLLDYRLFRNYGVVLYVAGLVLLGAVLVFGTTIRGTTGWFFIGPVQFQPVELVKPMMILALAAYFTNHMNTHDSWRTIAGSAAMALSTVTFVLLQPDLGSSLVLLAIWLGMLFATRIRRSQIVVILVALVGVAVLGFLFFLKPYQRDRILVFVDRDNPKYALEEGYNIIQSIVAVGSGQWTGRGLGLGPQSHLNFLPEQENDFIFAVIAEELGFVGAMVVLGLFLILQLRMVRIAKRAQDDFGLFVAWGIWAMFAVQVVINIGMNVGLAPVTGIPLPFLSAGGSALLANMASLGLLESIIARERKLTFF